MDLIILALLGEPGFWNYTFPVNLLCGVCLPAGFLIQLFLLKRNQRWFLLPLIFLGLSVCCEFLYQIDGTFDGFVFVFIGVLTYFALLGSFLFSLFHQVRMKIRHS